MKRNLIWMLCVIAAVALLLGGLSCQSTSPAPAPAPSPSPAPAPSPSPAPSAMKLKITTFTPADHLITRGMHEGFATIAEMTGGKLTAEFYDAGSLATSGESLDAVLNGVADIGWENWMYNPGVFPLSYAFTLSGMFPDATTATKVVRDVWASTTYLQAEYNRIVPLSFDISPPYILLLKSKVTTVDGLKGMRIRSQGGAETAVLEALGATAVQMGVSELYTSLERGLVAGAPQPIASVPPNKFYEVAKFDMDNVKMGGAFMGLGMNNNTWNKLSPELKAIVTQCAQDASVRIGAYYDSESNLARAFLATQGVEIYNLSPEELAKFDAACATVSDKWVKDTVAKGLPADKLLQVIRDTTVKYTSRFKK